MKSKNGKDDKNALKSIHFNLFSVALSRSERIKAYDKKGKRIVVSSFNENCFYRWTTSRNTTGIEDKSPQLSLKVFRTARFQRTYSVRSQPYLLVIYFSGKTVRKTLPLDSIVRQFKQFCIGWKLNTTRHIFCLFDGSEKSRLECGKRLLTSSLCSLPAYSSSKLDVFRHDCNSFGVNCTQVSVFK